MIVVVLLVSERFNKDAFYKIELEKANIILKTIEPLIALDLYLGTTNNIDRIGKDLVHNPNILSLKILRKNKQIYNITTPQSSVMNNSITIRKNILKPNSDKKIGEVILTYSSKDYIQLRQKYRNFTLFASVVLLFLFFALSLYIRKLLLPLKKISKTLKNYSPNTIIETPYVEENNEIGLISNALHEMQKKIHQYAKEQQDINKHLEDMVHMKTLELQNQLYTNNLTGLPNRLSLIEHTNLYNGSLAIINIDDFKEINDFYGNSIGDEIIIQLSLELKKILKKQPIKVNLFHLHADEFALDIQENISQEAFINLIETISHHIEKTTFHTQGNKIGLRVTIGATYGGKDKVTHILEKADIALKLAKKRRIPYLIYDENFNIEKQYKDNMHWIKNIKSAINDDRIIPYFQPIYDNKTTQLASCESLIRLIDKDGTVISPYKFLDIAKKSRLYSKLTRIMIQKSCQYFENVACNFSINLSIDDMLDEETIAFLKEQIAFHKVSNKITLEILETEGIENYEEITHFLQEMKTIGCKIAIDDFGSGYSSFEYLLKLNVDYIKIDGTLIKNIDTDENSKIVVETIVDFAKKLGILTIAEFVHSDLVYQTVKELGVDRSQGFYLCEPQKDIDELLHCNKSNNS